MNTIIKEKEKDYCKKGHEDDLIVRTLLSRELINNNTIHVIDVDKDLFFRNADVDLILINKFYNLATAEIKADGFPALGGTKYVFLETISNSNRYEKSGGTDGLGCCLTSKSHYFIFYFIKYNTYLILKTSKMKEFIEKNIDKYDKKQARTWSPDNKKIWYYSEGIIVPVGDLIIEAGGIYKTSRYNYEDIKKELFE
jgi:hypothetical protein